MIKTVEAFATSKHNSSVRKAAYCYNFGSSTFKEADFVEIINYFDDVQTAANECVTTNYEIYIGTGCVCVVCTPQITIAFKYYIEPPSSPSLSVY